MVAAAERHGVALVEAFMYRYHPRWARVRQLIDEGRIGPAPFARAAFGFHLGPDRAGDVRLSPTLGGGATQDVGCYAVNAVRWLLGEPRSVRGWALDRRGAGVDTHAAAVLSYPDGVLAEVACSFDVPLGQLFEVVGERGRIEVPLPFLPRGGSSIRVVVGGDERVESFAEVDQYGLEVRAVRALPAGRRAVAHARVGWSMNQRVLTAGEALNRSCCCRSRLVTTACGEVSLWNWLTDTALAMGHRGVRGIRGVSRTSPDGAPPCPPPS